MDFGKLEGGDLFVENKMSQQSARGRGDMAPIVAEADIWRSAIESIGGAALPGAGSNDRAVERHRRGDRSRRVRCANRRATVRRSEMAFGALSRPANHAHR